VKLVLRFPSPAFVASLLLDIINDPVALLIAALLSHLPPVSPVTLVVVFRLTLSAPTPQPIFTAGFFPKLTFVFPFFASGASLHFWLSSSVSYSQPLLMSLVGIFICTFFTPVCQSIFVPSLFVKLAFSLPLSAFATPFLFHSTNDPMGLLIRIVFFQRLRLFLVILAGIFTLALFAPRTQPIFALAVLGELTLVFPPLTFAASLHFCLSSLVSYRKPLLNTNFAFSCLQLQTVLFSSHPFVFFS